MAASNKGYGITAFLSTHGTFEYNTSYGSGDAASTWATHQTPISRYDTTRLLPTSRGSSYGDASTGSVTDNLVHDSCSGLVFLNTGTTTGVHNWRVSNNIVTHNDAFCSAEEAELPFSLTGVGILIGGGDHIVLRANRMLSNQPGGDPSLINNVPLAGGSVVVSTANVSVFPGFYGGVAEHNIIANNAVLGNQLFDLVYDDLGTGNHFVSNRCETSLPARLCR